MYTRSRQSQNFTSGTPQRGQQGNQQQFQQQYNQGNYQGQMQGQQQGTPFKQQQQQQQPTPQPQRNLQQGQTPQQQRNIQQKPQQQQTPQQQKPQQQTPQQQKPQQQTPQQQKPQQQQQQQAAVQQAPAQPQRLKPILKSSLQGNAQEEVQADVQANNDVNSAENAQSNNGMDIGEISENAEGEATDVPKWRRRVPGYKISRRAKRLRINQRLRKVLQPKNAIMVLHEMKTGVQFVFPETQSVLPSSLFLAHAEINGKTYVGQGISKPLARQNAAENALKSLLLEKMTAAAHKAHTDAESDSAAEGENKQENPENMETNSETPDEIPWSSLASFALYKLFLEWQNQGTVVPVPRPGLSPKIKKEGEKKPIEKKELPPNAETIHPVMLLNQMRPGLTYTEVARVGNPPNITFTLAIEVDGQEYVGTAKNKKDAKKFAAKAALHGLYNLVYPEEREGEDVTMA